MNDAAPRPFEPPYPPPRWRRWFAFLGGGVAWTLHLLGVYLIAEFTCVSGADHTRWLGTSVTAWAVLGLSLCLLLISLAATWIGRRDSRDATQTQTGENYLSRVGWMLSGLFALIILFESLPMLYYLDGC